MLMNFFILVPKFLKIGVGKIYEVFWINAIQKLQVYFLYFMIPQTKWSFADNKETVLEIYCVHCFHIHQPASYFFLCPADFPLPVLRYGGISTTWTWLFDASKILFHNPG